MPTQPPEVRRRSRVALAAGAVIAVAAASLALGAVAPAQADPSPPPGSVLPSTGYTLLDVDSESAPYPAPPSLDGTAKGAFDGDDSTQWASAYNGGSPDPMPHYLTFDIGGVHTLTGLGYSVKVQGNGPAKDVEVLTTDDPAVAKDGASTQWVSAGTATFTQPTTNAQIQYVTFAQPVSTRYVQFRVLDAINGSANASASELVVYTTDSLAGVPAGRPIPRTQYAVVGTDSQQSESGDGSAGAAFDEDYSSQWASEWSPTATDYPHWITFDVGGSFTLTGLGYSVKVQPNGPVKDVSVFTTDDRDVAKDPAAAGWTAAGSATFAQPTSSTQVQNVVFDQRVKARYVRFQAANAVNGSSNASAAEIVAYSTDDDTTPVAPPRPAAATVTTDSVDGSTWRYPDGTPASPFVDADGTFHFGESHANYYNEADGSNGDIRQWNWYTGTDFDTAKPDDALNAAGTNPDTTDFCNASPTGVDSTKAPAGSSYTQPNYCDITQMWVDPDSGDWYGLVHNEFTPQPFGDGLHYDAIDYAVSTDQGKTWSIPGHAITSPYSTTRGDTTAFPQQTYSYGDGDPRLYVDHASGYFYAFYGSRVVNKTGGWVAFYEHVARAPISGKMATGTWQKWYDGTWTEPGISGKESNMVPVADDSETGYTPVDQEYDPNTPGTAQQQIANGQMPATSPLFVMDVTYDAYLGLYIGQPQNPDQSGNAPQEFYATKNLATQKWFRLGDTGSAYTTASWYRWFVDPANKTSSAIVGKSFRSYCSFGCMNDAAAQFANITIDAGPSVSPATAVDTSKAYSVANPDGRALAVGADGKSLVAASGPDRAHGAWTFAATGDGAYTIATQSGLLLGVDGSSTAGRAWGAGLTLTTTAGVGQQWFVVPNTDPATGTTTGTVRLVNRYSGLVLGLDGTTAATTPGRTWDAPAATTGQARAVRAASAAPAGFPSASSQVIGLAVFADPAPGTGTGPGTTPAPGSGSGSTGTGSASPGATDAGAARSGDLATTGGVLAVIPLIAAGVLVLTGTGLLVRRRLRARRS